MKVRALLACSAGLAIWAMPAAAGPCTDQINAMAKALTAKDAGSGPTSGMTSSRTETPQAEHPPTSRMNQAAGQSAGSPQDVQRQTQGQPTAAEQAQGARPHGGPDFSGATAALDRARSLDAKGQESQCMDALREARNLAHQ
jgi:hypothetical protein